MSAHTPGPWVNCFEEGRWKKYPKLEVRTEWSLLGGSVGYAPIARVIGDKRVANHAQRLADLRLIAAAPDLLAALEICAQFMSIASDWNIDEAEINGEMRSTSDLIEVVRAAIAQARGTP